MTNDADRSDDGFALPAVREPVRLRRGLFAQLRRVSGFFRAAPPPDGGGPMLLVTDARGAAAWRALRDSVVIGRAVDCDIRVEDVMASQHHARLDVVGDGSVVVLDLESRNGTWLNGQRLDGPARLRSGDILRAGGSTFGFIVSES